MSIRVLVLAEYAMHTWQTRDDHYCYLLLGSVGAASVSRTSMHSFDHDPIPAVPGRGS